MQAERTLSFSLSLSLSLSLTHTHTHKPAGICRDARSRSRGYSEALASTLLTHLPAQMVRLDVLYERIQWPTTGQECTEGGEGGRDGWVERGRRAGGMTEQKSSDGGGGRGQSLLHMGENVVRSEHVLAPGRQARRRRARRGARKEGRMEGTEERSRRNRRNRRQSKGTTNLFPS